jgi:hypothetical protein
VSADADQTTPAAAEQGDEADGLRPPLIAGTLGDIQPSYANGHNHYRPVNLG